MRVEVLCVKSSQVRKMSIYIGYKITYKHLDCYADNFAMDFKFCIRKIHGVNYMKKILSKIM